MSLVGIGTAIAPLLSKGVTTKITKQIAKGINSHFNPTEIEKALMKKATESAEATQPETGGIFFRCQSKEAKDFLEKFFHSDLVVNELQRPLHVVVEKLFVKEIVVN
jgi:hypothetical protein